MYLRNERLPRTTSSGKEISVTFNKLESHAWEVLRRPRKARHAVVDYLAGKTSACGAPAEVCVAVYLDIKPLVTKSCGVEIETDTTFWVHWGRHGMV